MESNNNNSVPSPEPSFNSDNLKKQYLALLSSNGYSVFEAEKLLEIRLSRLNNLKKVNPDKLAWIINTKQLDDEHIYRYLLNSFKQHLEKEKLASFNYANNQR